MTMTVILGFFIFKIVWYLTHLSGRSWVIGVHHILAICIFVVPLYLGHSGAEICALTFWSEVTIPPLMVYWFMRESGCRKIHVLLMEYGFLISYFYSRFVICTFFIYDLVVHPSTHPVLRYLLASMYIVSWLFFKDSFIAAVRHTQNVCKEKAS